MGLGAGHAVLLWEQTCCVGIFPLEKSNLFPAQSTLSPPLTWTENEGESPGEARISGCSTNSHTAYGQICTGAHRSPDSVRKPKSFLLGTGQGLANFGASFTREYHFDPVSARAAARTQLHRGAHGAGSIPHIQQESRNNTKSESLEKPAPTQPLSLVLFSFSFRSAGQEA